MCASRPQKVASFVTRRKFVALFQRTDFHSPLFLCVDVVYLTFPLRRTVGLVEVSKKEFCLVQSSGLGTTTTSTLRGVLGESGWQRGSVYFCMRVDAFDLLVPSLCLEREQPLTRVALCGQARARR